MFASLLFLVWVTDHEAPQHIVPQSYVWGWCLFFLLCGDTNCPWLPHSYLDDRVNLLRIFLHENRAATFRSIGSSSSVIFQTTGPKPLTKRFLHIVRSRASSFNSQYPLLSLRSSSNFLRLLPCLLVTFICPFIFPSITCFRRQFLHKMWPIQLI